MKAILIYHKTSGHNYFSKHYYEVIRELTSIFDTLDIYNTESIKETNEIILNHLNIDVLLVAGGDGTFHNIINILSRLDTPKLPALAFFNNGTSSDTILNLGLGKSYKKTIKALKANSIHKLDVFKVKDALSTEYCLFMSAIGAFSKVAYKTKRKFKRILGKFAYYLESIKELFRKYKVTGTYILEDKQISFNTSFILLLNGKHIANFNINKQSKLDDGKIEFMYSDSKLFHGLLSYFFKTKKLHNISVDKLYINTKRPVYWCLDGEQKLLDKDVEITVLTKAINVYCFL